MTERQCAGCGELIMAQAPMVLEIATGNAWHYDCKNPMSALNAELDARRAAEEKMQIQEESK